MPIKKKKKRRLFSVLRFFSPSSTPLYAPPTLQKPLQIMQNISSSAPMSDTDEDNFLVGSIVIWDPVKEIAGDLVDIFSQEDVFIGRSKTWYALSLLINLNVYSFQLTAFVLVLVTYKSTACIFLTSTFASTPSSTGKMTRLVRSPR